MTNEEREQSLKRMDLKTLRSIHLDLVEYNQELRSELGYHQHQNELPQEICALRAQILALMRENDRLFEIKMENNPIVC